jgi:hypothetical protein
MNYRISKALPPITLNGPKQHLFASLNMNGGLDVYRSARRTAGNTDFALKPCGRRVSR